jgi:hypothetical protein
MSASGDDKVTLEGFGVPPAVVGVTAADSYAAIQEARVRTFRAGMTPDSKSRLPPPDDAPPDEPLVVGG